MEPFTGALRARKENENKLTTIHTEVKSQRK